MIDQILGHYRILSKIGEGGMGAVYRARDQVLQRDVAIKVVSERTTGDTSAREILLHEARASSALSHPNICTVHEVGEMNGELYIVMELVEGKSLSALIASAGLPCESVLRYGVQIAGALAHSHGRSIVHRDLKSSNVVVTPDGLVKVLDFGLARRLFSEAPAEATRTIGPLDSDARIVGTLPYMAPELLRGVAADERSDLWALGVVLFEAATGQLPFRGRTTFEITSAITHELPPPMPSWTPRGLWAVIQRCLAKEPAQRYQRAAEVQAALEAVQSAAMTGPALPVDPKGFSTTVLRSMRHIAVKNGDLLLMVGTAKGAFLLRSTAARARWEVGCPYFHRQAVFAMAYDGRNGRHRLWASTQSAVWGTILRSSDDFGKTWTNPMEANLKFPAESGASLKNIWQVCLGRPEEPDVLYCGVEPAALFESRDAGESWSLNRGLFDHPHRPRWMPSFGGLILHTIIPDPANRQRMYAAISAGGVYVTGDAGASWRAANRGIRVVFIRFRFRHGDAPARSRLCVHPSGRVRRVPLHPRRQAARLSDAQRRSVVGSADAVPAPEGGLRDCPARRDDGRVARPGGHLFRRPQRNSKRLSMDCRRWFA